MVNTSSIHLPSIDFYGFCAERSGGATTPTTPFCEPSVDEPIDSSEKWELQKQMFLAMATKNMLEISQRAHQLKVVELNLFLQASRPFGFPVSTFSTREICMMKPLHSFNYSVPILRMLERTFTSPMRRLLARKLVLGT